MHLKIHFDGNYDSKLAIFKVGLYDSDGVLTKYLEYGDVVIDLLENMKVEITEGSLYLPNTNE